MGRIAAISDLHGQFPIIPELHDQEIDVLLVAGDIAGGSHITNAQYKSMGEFVKWVHNIKPKKCFIIPGNHDYWDFKEIFKYRQNTDLISCIIDCAEEFQGLNVYGSPWSIPFLNWNWMNREDRLEIYYDNIPNNTDILITHGPALGMCDMPLEPIHGQYKYEHMGSMALLKAIWCRTIPRVISGHIHSAAHSDIKLAPNHPTICSCVSLLDEEYKIKFPPKIFEI